MQIIKQYKVVREELILVWKKRKAVSVEALRAMKEGPAAFRAADLRTKIAVIAILVMVSTIIVNLFRV
jgi:hypothetical protein